MEMISPKKVRSIPLRALYDWYQEAKGNLKWPPVSAFRISELPAYVWPHIGRVDIELDPFRVYYRAVGEYLCDARGFNLSKKYLDELAIVQMRELEGWYRFALTIDNPYFAGGYQHVDNTRFYYETVCMPLGTRQDNPRAFLIAEEIYGLEPWREVVRKRRYGEAPLMSGA